MEKLKEEARVLVTDKQQLVKMFDTLSKERDSANGEAQKAKKEKQEMQIELNRVSQAAKKAALDKENAE